ELCYYQKRFADAARLARDALTAYPELAMHRGGAWHRYNAACYAALAAAGEGRDAARLSDAERRRWRQQAIGWLQAELAAWQNQLRGSDAKGRQAVGDALAEWLADHALASLRDPASRERLPLQEQQALRQLWTAVDALLLEARK